MSSRQSNGPDDGFEVPLPDAPAGELAVVVEASWLAVVVFGLLVADTVPVVILLVFVVVAV